MYKSLLPACLLPLLAACVPHPPHPIDRELHANPSLRQVRMDIDAFIGTELRWGGIISRVENRSDDTWIEIVRHPLRENGRPRGGAKSDGRFVASIDGFVDPVVYEVGRSLTVVGTIVGHTSRKIGDFDYRLVIVEVEGSYLWKNETEVPYYRGYPPHWYYYDPWYRPWGPYRHRYHPHFH